MLFVYFGRLAEVAQCGEEEANLPEGIRTTAELRGWLNQRFDTGEFVSERVRIAVDDQLAARDRPLADARKIALLPPVGGG